jgi:hypothetical protein
MHQGIARASSPDRLRGGDDAPDVASDVAPADSGHAESYEPGFRDRGERFFRGFFGFGSGTSAAVR